MVCLKSLSFVATYRTIAESSAKNVEAHLDFCVDSIDFVGYDPGEEAIDPEVVDSFRPAA